MLKERGHKGSWKGASNPNRSKKKSYGNNDLYSAPNLNSSYLEKPNLGNFGGQKWKCLDFQIFVQIAS